MLTISNGHNLSPGPSIFPRWSYRLHCLRCSRIRSSLPTHFQRLTPHPPLSRSRPSVPHLRTGWEPKVYTLAGSSFWVGGSFSSSKWPLKTVNNSRERSKVALKNGKQVPLLQIIIQHGRKRRNARVEGSSLKQASSGLGATLRRKSVKELPPPLWTLTSHLHKLVCNRSGYEEDSSLRSLWTLESPYLWYRR